MYQQLLHERRGSAACTATKAIQVLQRYCHAVLINFSSVWILDGQLLDPFKEFFVMTGKAPTRKSRHPNSGPILANASACALIPAGAVANAGELQTPLFTENVAALTPPLIRYAAWMSSAR